MLSHYFKIINYNIKSYIKQFIIIMKLLYAHIMKQRMLKAIEMLKKTFTLINYLINLIFEIIKKMKMTMRYLSI